ncbi:MAG: aryl-sulfate sulfotransferase, partial [Bacteroidota bacterium]
HDTSAICSYLMTTTLRWQNNMHASTVYIFDRRGETVWYSQGEENYFDFKVHPDGRFSYSWFNARILLNADFTPFDTLECIGLQSDPHDFIITEDGHYFMMCFEDSIVDMSAYSTYPDGEPGSTGASLRSCVIQEVDADSGLVKSWHGRAHFGLDDIEPRFLTSRFWAELNHANSMDLNEAGQLLLSFRANHEISLVDWETGEMIWRLGGANNEFAHPNDDGTYAQHDARFLSGNRISVFDNGNFAMPPASRSVIYALDTAARIAHVETSYPQAFYAEAMGSFRVQDNGDVVVGTGLHGVPGNHANIRYMRGDGSPVLDITLAENNWVYRAVCDELPFLPERPQIQCDTFAGQARLSLPETHAQYLWNTLDTLATLTVKSIGEYQVFVPQGVGMIGSPVFVVDNLEDPCTRKMPNTPPSQVVAYYDLLGRRISGPKAGVVFIELYDNGDVKRRFIHR